MAETISWITPDGLEYIMTGQDDIRVQFYRKGAYMPPFSIKRIEVPPPPVNTSGGLCTVANDVKVSDTTIVTELSTDPRQIEMEILFRGTDAIDLRNNVRTWMKRFNPLTGEGRIQVVGPDGSKRFLKCRYTRGFEGEEIKGRKGDTFLYMIGIWESSDSYWYNAIGYNQTFTLTPNTAPSLPITLPFQLYSTTLIAGIPIMNNGDVEAFPIWEVGGPGANLQIMNLSLPGDVAFNSIGFPSGGYTLAANEIITIDTSPGKKTVIRKSDAMSLYENLTNGSYFFPLKPGANTIQVQLSNATVASYVRLTFNERYLTV
jgi:hypothetical protein